MCRCTQFRAKKEKISIFVLTSFPSPQFKVKLLPEAINQSYCRVWANQWPLNKSDQLCCVLERVLNWFHFWSRRNFFYYFIKGKLLPLVLLLVFLISRSKAKNSFVSCDLEFMTGLWWGKPSKPLAKTIKSSFLYHQIIHKPNYYESYD